MSERDEIEAFFQQWEALGYRFPRRGQEIQWRRKGATEWAHATVDFCFAGVEPTVKLHGHPPFMFPTLGDEWRPVPLVDPQEGRQPAKEAE